MPDKVDLIVKNGRVVTSTTDGRADIAISGGKFVAISAPGELGLAAKETYDADGKVLPPDDFEAQARMVMENLTKALAAGGAKISDVTKITIYICNPHDVPKARGILQSYFAGQPPASTLCILRGLANPNFLLEIEAIAAV